MTPSDNRRLYESGGDRRRYESSDNRRLCEWASLTGDKLPEELGPCGPNGDRED